ncbi:hypothetical protein IIC38_09750 [candidate division KSB1 bacterium]|nr:hypothetical protein [candidate division KSB1 bacterium]
MKFKIPTIFSIKFWLCYLSFFVLISQFELPPLYAQSRNEKNSDEEVVDPILRYEIQNLNIEIRWAEFALYENFADLIELRQFSKDAVEKGDYELALIYLDEIIELTDEQSSDSTIQYQLAALDESFEFSKDNFTTEIVFGMDFSEQEYNLTFGLSDSTFIDSQNNPYSGFRLRWASYQANNFKVELDGLMKVSRDYTSWQAQSQFTKNFITGFEIHFGQVFDGLSYKRSFPIEYWQSSSNLILEKRFGDDLALSIGDEFQYRSYENESESFPTFQKNEFQTVLRASDFLNSRLTIDFTIDQRIQKTFQLYDYVDRRFSIQHSFNSSLNTSFLGWYQFRDMKYTQVNSDSSFLTDFRQHFITLNVSQSLIRSVSLKLSGEVILRDHPETYLYTPDFTYLRFEPGFLFDLSNQLNLGINYILESKEYKKNEVQQSNLLISQNKLSQGLLLSLDFFNYKNLLCSLSHTFMFNSYPDAGDEPIPGFSLYTNRSQNSTLLYLSYQVIDPLEITLVMQYDLDKDREIKHNDSRSSIFSLDINWKF